MTRDESKSDWIDEICPDCRGTGAEAKLHPVNPGHDKTVSAPPCPACGGTGRKRKPG